MAETAEDEAERLRQEAASMDGMVAELMRSPAQGQALLASSLKRFISVFHWQTTRRKFIFKPFHVAIINALEDVVFNRQRNIVINIPVRWGKSALTKYFLAWAWAVNPKCNNIYTSYSDDLVRKFSGEIKDIVQSQLYFTLFGIRIRQDSHNKSLWKIENGGEMRATSMGSSITGFGAGTLEDGYGGAVVIDDPLKADDGHSDTAKRQCVAYFEETLSTRRNNRNTPFIIIMQRLAIDDLIGWIKGRFPEDYEFLEFPAIGADGESIWPERFPTAVLRKMQKDSPYMFAAQYMQEPVAKGGNLFKSEMFTRGPMPDYYDYTFITCDTASTSKETSDYTVAGHWGVRHFGDNEKRLYLLDIIRDRIDAARCEDYIVPFIRKHSRQSFIGALIEPKGHGIYLNQKMPEYGVPMRSRSEIDEFFRDRRFDKVARANIIIPSLNTFPVIVSPDINDFVFEELRRELLAFPDGAHDDFVDVLTDAAKFTYSREASILDAL